MKLFLVVLRRLLIDLQLLIKWSNKKNSIDREKNYRMMKESLEKIKRDINDLKSQKLSIKNPEIKRECENKIKTFESQKEEISQQLKEIKKKYMLGIEDDPFESPSSNDMGQNQVVQEGLSLQDKTKKEASKILKNVKETLKTADNIENSLEEIRTRLIQIDESQQRIEGTLSRAQKYLTYFAKAIQTDKLLLCLIISCCILLIGAIIFYLVKK